MRKVLLFLLLALPCLAQVTVNKCQVGGGGSGSPTFVQSAYNSPGYNSSNSIAATFSTAVGTNNCVVGMVVWNSTTNTISSISDGQGNTYTTIDSAQGGGYTGTSFYAQAISGSPTVVTVTFSGTNTFAGITLHEVTGCSTTAALDGHAGRYQTYPGTGTDAVTSGSFNTTIANGYVFGAVADVNGQAIQFVEGTGFTQRRNTAFLSLASEDLIKAVAGATAATYTIPSGFPTMLIFGVAVK